LFFSTIPISLFGQQKDYIQMLQGTWKFQVGDSIIWSESDYNDSQWDMVNVPSAWEDQGFYGLDGFAWYRKEINLPKDIKSKDLFISLGYINDVDQVYLNGNLLGFSGSISPKFVTALDVERKYPIPQEYWNLQGRNVISVRVYNHHMSGGIITGTIGIYEENFFKPDISLIGLWRFRAGDNIAWKDKGHNDKNWRMMVVPGNWKCHGYKDYEGIGWYRTVFSIPDEIKNQKLVFVAGKIENCDEVYINGIQIGNTGKIRPLKRKMSPFDSSNSSENIVTDDCSKPRMYAIPDDLLNQDGENIISIRVYNKNFKGGITDGPIGIIRQTSLNRHIKDKQLQLFND
jgi:sialate O-acetylesterase